MAVNWDKQPLGEVTDAEIGRRVGVSRERVRQVRSARGIAAVPRNTELINWRRVSLGKRPDQEISDELGICVSAVRSRRIDAGIAGCPDPRRIHNAKILTRKTLLRLYVRDELSTYAISELLEVCQGVVAGALKRHGIGLRSRDEAMQTTSTRDLMRVAALERQRRKRKAKS